MKSKTFICSLFFFFLLLAYSGRCLLAQDEDTLKGKVPSDSLVVTKYKPLLWWISLGYGVSTISEANQFGYAIGAHATLEYGHHFFSVRAVHDDGGNFIVPNQMVFDLGLLYGIGSHHTLWFGNASIGLAYTATTKRIFVRQEIINSFLQDVYRAELYRGIGFAWDVQLFSKFSDSSNVGLGISICGNVNKSLPFWMLLLSLEFGNF